MSPLTQLRNFMSQYRGSPLGIKFVIALYNTFGYAAAKKVVSLVSLFYALVSRAKRQEMESFYKNVGLTNSFKTYFRHIYAFSLTIFDRFISKEGMQKELEVERINIKAFESLQKTGGMMIFSHHGNWAQSFKIFQTYDITLNIIGDEAIDENLHAIEGETQNRRINIISLKNGMQAMLDIARALQNNEVVIIMVDRVKELEKTVEVDFLGVKTLLHSGGFEIAMMRKAPIVACDIIRAGDQHIKIEFSDLIVSEKKNKKEKLADLAQQYADFLSGRVQAYPYQWFNFFDFWDNLKAK